MLQHGQISEKQHAEGRSQTLKGTLYNSIHMKLQSRRLHRDRKEMRGGEGLGRGGSRGDHSRVWVMEMVLGW